MHLILKRSNKRMGKKEKVSNTYKVISTEHFKLARLISSTVSRQNVQQKMRMAWIDDGHNTGQYNPPETGGMTCCRKICPITTTCIVEVKVSTSLHYFVCNSVPFGSVSSPWTKHTNTDYHNCSCLLSTPSILTCTHSGKELCRCVIVV